MNRLTWTALVPLLLSMAMVFSTYSYGSQSGLETFAVSLVLSAPLIFTFLLFFSMTIELKGDMLTWYFGFGFWRKVVKGSDIVDISLYQTKWYQGIGIRMLSDGWLYNASTGSAIKLSLSVGKNIYIGCKDA